MSSEVHYATGRRKTSSARVYLQKGKGSILVNDRKLDEYFGRKVAQMLVMQPLELVELTDKVDIKIMVKGGGSFRVFRNSIECVVLWGNIIGRVTAIFLNTSS